MENDTYVRPGRLRAGPGRPRIGVKVDFRVPAEADAIVRALAVELDMPIDAVYRQVVCAQLGIQADGGER